CCSARLDQRGNRCLLVGKHPERPSVFAERLKAGAAASKDEADAAPAAQDGRDWRGGGHATTSSSGASRLRSDFSIETVLGASEGLCRPRLRRSEPAKAASQASFARARFTMSETEPPGRTMRHMPGYFSSGTISPTTRLPK